MSTHLLRLHGAPTKGQSVSAPIRALGALERRMTRRGHQARGSATPAGTSSGDQPVEKLAYWVGDERETTQGDW